MFHEFFNPFYYMNFIISWVLALSGLDYLFKKIQKIFRLYLVIAKM